MSTATTFRVLEYVGDVHNASRLSDRETKQPDTFDNYLEYTVTASTSAGSTATSNIQTPPLRRNIRRHQQQWRFFFSSVSQVIKDLFLPIDYPSSVESNYIQYQFYDSIQGLSSYLRGVVSTSAVLQVAGVGSSKADALSAAMAWATRDGIGMLGGLLFSYFASPFFDGYVKEFRLFADVINDVGLTLDMAAPLFPANQVLVVSCMATICKVMCGMAAGATKASITAHFAIRGNMADLSAKESSQETLMTLVGMSLGILLAKWLRHIGSGATSSKDNEEEGPGAEALIMWCVFLILTMLHIWANYRGMVLLKLKSLNKKRAQIALSKVIDECSNKISMAVNTNVSSLPPSPKISPHDAEQMILHMILTPNEVSESILPNLLLIFRRKLYLGVKISELFKYNHQNSDLSLFQLFWDEKYLLWLHKQRVYVSLRWDAQQRDELKAFLHALILQNYLATIGNSVMMKSVTMISMTKTVVDTLYGDGLVFLNAMGSRGWDISKLYLDFGKSRADWISKDD